MSRNRSAGVYQFPKENRILIRILNDGMRSDNTLAGGVSDHVNTKLLEKESTDRNTSPGPGNVGFPVIQLGQDLRRRLVSGMVGRDQIGTVPLKLGCDGFQGMFPIQILSP